MPEGWKSVWLVALACTLLGAAPPPTTSDDGDDGQDCRVSMSAAPKGAPKFADYPAAPESLDRLADPTITKDFSFFRTAIRRTSQVEGVNFAGRYTLVLIGAGTGRCMAVVDRRTGQVFGGRGKPESVVCFTPQFDVPEDDVGFRRDSRLVVFNGLYPDEGGERGLGYYVLRGDVLAPVAFYGRSELCRGR